LAFGPLLSPTAQGVANHFAFIPINIRKPVTDAAAERRNPMNETLTALNNPIAVVAILAAIAVLWKVVMSSRDNDYQKQVLGVLEKLNSTFGVLNERLYYLIENQKEDHSDLKNQLDRTFTSVVRRLDKIEDKQV
jgi:hypothetical protein